MKLISAVYKERSRPGVFFAFDDSGGFVLPPVLCRGEADNTAAGNAGNPEEDPTKPFGDHPEGLFQVDAVLEIHGAAKKAYGPFFILLDPLDGEVLKAKQNGRTGIGIHGGEPGQAGTVNALRATYGCLRVSNGVVALLAGLLKGHLSAGLVVRYECRVIDEEA